MLTIFLCGDVMTGRGIDQILAHPGDPRLYEPYVGDACQYVNLAEQRYGGIVRPVEDHYVWGFALEHLQELNPAARIINLETAVTTSDRFWKEKGIHYRMSPANIGCLTAAQIDCCTLANNHVLDWGYKGLAETLEVLQRAGLKTTGAGENQVAARAPATLPTDTGRRILVFGVATTSSGVPLAWSAVEHRPGIHLLSDLSRETITAFTDTLNAARRDDSDIVIVSIHWGGNWGYDITRQQRQFAHQLIEQAGVDIVHGHSSHHVKGIEVHRERLILYGCGDLITDYEGISGHETFRGDLGLMYFPQLDPATGSLAALWIQPTQLRQMQLRQPPDSDVAWLASTLNREGRPLGTHVDLHEDGMLQVRWK